MSSLKVVQALIIDSSVNWVGHDFQDVVDVIIAGQNSLIEVIETTWTDYFTQLLFDDVEHRCFKTDIQVEVIWLQGVPKPDLLALIMCDCSMHSQLVIDVWTLYST